MNAKRTNMCSFELFDYQKEDLDRLCDDYNETVENDQYQRALVSIPMGGGKTNLAFSYIQKLEEAGNKSFIVVCPTLKILIQTCERFDEYDIDQVFHFAIFASQGKNGLFHSTKQVIQEWFKNHPLSIIFTTYLSFPKLMKFIKPDVVVLDEVHRMKRWGLLENDVHYVGMSATPVGCPFRKVVHRSLGWGIDAGALCDYQIEFLMVDSYHPVSIIDWIIEEGLSKKILVVSRYQADAIHIAKGLEGAGIAAESVIGDDSQSQRAKSEKRFRKEKVAVLSTVNIYREGSDIQEIDSVFYHHKVKSKTAWFQIFGRALRKFPGKTKSRIYIPFIYNQVEKMFPYFTMVLTLLKTEEDGRSPPYRVRYMEKELRSVAKQLEHDLDTIFR